MTMKHKQCLLPTKEQLAERDRKMKERIQNTIIARIAISEHIGVPWKRGAKSVTGEIDCPVCKAEKSLGFSRSGYNGHIHASCSTEGCVCWME